MGDTGMMAVIRMMTVVEGVDLDGYSGVRVKQNSVRGQRQPISHMLLAPWRPADPCYDMLEASFG